MRTPWSLVLIASAAVAGAALAQDSAREMRTLRVEGGYIRYEVLPGDDQAPAGTVSVVPMRPPARKAEVAEPAAPARAEEKEGDADAGKEARRKPHGRRACRAERGKLAARILELQGLDEPADVAQWIEHHPTFFSLPYGFAMPGLGAYLAPTLAALMTADFVARGYAEDLARCELRESQSRTEALGRRRRDR